MADKVSLTQLASLQNELTAINEINENSVAITTAIDNTLSRDGTLPNQMLSELDMNSHRVINLPQPQSGTDPIRLQDYNTLLSGGTINISSAMGIEYVMTQGGLPLLIGVQGDIQVPFNCVITSVTLLADQTGSCVLDIWKDTYANFPPTIADTITGSALPTITSSIKYTDSTLTGWNTNISAGDVLRYNINSNTNITKLTVSLGVTKT